MVITSGGLIKEMDYQKAFPATGDRPALPDTPEYLDGISQKCHTSEKDDKKQPSRTVHKEGSSQSS